LVDVVPGTDHLPVVSKGDIICQDVIKDHHRDIDEQRVHAQP